MRLGVVDEFVKIVGLSPYCMLKYFAKFLLIMGRLKEFGYKNMWSTWIHHNLSPNHDRERLQIVKPLLDR